MLLKRVPNLLIFVIQENETYTFEIRDPQFLPFVNRAIYPLCDPPITAWKIVLSCWAIQNGRRYRMDDCIKSDDRFNRARKQGRIVERRKQRLIE